MSAAYRVTEVCTGHGEGPVWDPVARRFLVMDMLEGAVVDLAAEGRTRHRIADVAAAMRPRAAGGFVLATERGFQLLDADLRPDGSEIPAFADARIRMNDGGCDPAGRFYCGTMAYDETPGAGVLYRFDADRSVHPVLSGVTISNGLQWSADGGTAFYVDTPTGRIDAFDVTEDGDLVGRRPFVEIPAEVGAPDGLAIDVEDGLWVALFGGGAVHRYDASGALTQVVEVGPRDTTACAFGGDDGTTLLITTSRTRLGDAAEPDAGAVFAVDAGIRGAGQHAFAG